MNARALGSCEVNQLELCFECNQGISSMHPTRQLATWMNVETHKHFLSLSLYFSLLPFLNWFLKSSISNLYGKVKSHSIGSLFFEGCTCLFFSSSVHYHDEGGEVSPSGQGNWPLDPFRNTSDLLFSVLPQRQEGPLMFVWWFVCSVVTMIVWHNETSSTVTAASKTSAWSRGSRAKKSLLWMRLEGLGSAPGVHICLCVWERERERVCNSGQEGYMSTLC